MRRFVKLLPAMILSLFVAACLTGQEERNEKAAISDALRESAITSFKRGNYAMAANQFGKLYVGSPGDLDVVVGYLESLRRIGAAEDGIRIVDLEMDNLGQDLQFLLTAAKIQIASGYYKKAITILEDARRGWPRDWRIFSLLGIAKDSMERYERAQASYRAGLELSPGNPAITNNLALSLAQSGDLDGAIATLREAVGTTGRGDARIRQNLAILFGFKGRFRDFEALARMDLSDDMVQKNLEVFRALHLRQDAE